MAVGAGVTLVLSLCVLAASSQALLLHGRQPLAFRDVIARLAGVAQQVSRIRNAVHSTHQPPYPEPPPDSVELCSLRGFECARHEVDTEDGYRLAVIHVVGRMQRSPRVRGPPVLVQHGMLMSSDAFLLRRDEGNLPLVLSDAGYDVWIGNYRGNAVSPQVHEHLSPSSYAFWNYSWHELGLFDLPAMVDLVLERSGHRQLHYIGHSMGSTGMLVLLSRRPEYNAKLRLASFLAPVAYVSRLRSPLFTRLADIAPTIKEWLTKHHIWNVLPRNPALHRLANSFCTEHALPTAAEMWLCNSIEYEIAGRSPEHVLPSYSALLTAYVPAGTTIRIMEHYYEVARTGIFRPLGKGMGDPDSGPKYNMSLVTAPVALFYSQNDMFVYPPDVDDLAADLPNVVSKHMISHPTFNHFDFLLASDGQMLLYDWLLLAMNNTLS